MRCECGRYVFNHFRHFLERINGRGLTIPGIYELPQRSRDISVGIATGCGLDGLTSIPGRGERLFSTPQRPDLLWGPPSLLSNGYRGSSPGIKRPGREADHSCLRVSIAEVKMAELYLHFYIRFHGVVFN
jgi:hypothetical protein